MPFITEELWEKTAEAGPPRDSLLISRRGRELPASYADAEAEAEMALVIADDPEGRSVRSELNVPPAARPPLLVTEAGPRAAPHPGGQHRARSASCCAVDGLRFERRAGRRRRALRWPRRSLRAAGRRVHRPAAERARLTKEIAALAADIDRTAKKLANADFVARAPEEVVEENRERLAEAEAARERLAAALRRLEGMG